MKTGLIINMQERNEQLNEIYQKLLEFGFGNAPLDDSIKFIDENVMGYGTALDEKIMSYNDFRELIIAQRNQAANFDDFIYKSNPVINRLFNEGRSALIVDEIDLTSVINGEKNKMTVRMSTMLEFNKVSWKVVHWHGSIAEHVSDGEDPWHVNEWKQKTAELQKLVDQKTVDLVNKNRELEIEASLEKVRAIAMGMSKSEDLLDICEISYHEFEKLGFENLRAVLIHILDDESRTFTDYDYCELFGGEISTLSYDSHPVVVNYFKQIKSRKDAFAEAVLSGEELESWKKVRLETGQKDDPRLNDTDALYYYGYSIGFGDFSISTLKPIDETQIRILKRFRNIFDLAYRRYNDISLAEEQAREAQIELSLERIRAQVTAMQTSSELLNIVVTMRTEFVALGHEAHYFWHMRWLPEKYEKAMTSGDGTRIGMVMELPRHIHGDIKLIADWEKNDEPTVIYTMDVEAALEYVNKMINLGDFKQIDPNAPSEDDIRHINGLTFVMARTTHGEIGFSLPGTVPNPPQESVTTLARFAGVFDLAYKRFEDLKSTERQYREAQIELALERTRTQSMLMKHSSELNDISKTFHEQLLNLGIDSEFSFVWLPDEAKQEHMFWATWANEINGVTQYQSKAVKYPLDKTEPGTAKCYRDWESGQSLHETYIPPDQIDSFFATWEELLEGAEQFKPELFPEGIYYTEAYMKYGCFGIDIRRQLTSEEKEIIRRFSVEFERTYTRFLDLQKAEEQRKIIQAENDRKTEELEEARKLQLAMLPKELPKLAKLDIAVYMQTATEVGGDYYDFSTKDDGSLNVCLGDATGHGLKAGTLVAMMKSLFVNDSVKLDINKFFNSSNETLKKMSLNKMMMAFAMINIYGNKIKIANAGIPPVYIYRKNEHSVEEVNLNGLPIGAMKNFKYDVYESKVDSGDVILMMSDGMPELQNKNDEMFGYEKIKEMFSNSTDRPSDEIIKVLENESKVWTAGREPGDDITFVVIKVK